LYDIFLNKCYDDINCHVNEGDIVFDIGANLGLFSYYSILKGAKKVYAFEPGESQSNAIKDNFGSFNNLVVEQKAVSSETGILRFSKHKNKSILSGFFDDESNEDYTISECYSVNLVDYCKENNINKINFLKIDCEGSEYKIFESLTDEFIKNVDKVAMEYHLNINGRVRYLIERLESNGFIVNVSNIESEVGNLTAYNKKLNKILE
jgi:FkbM family methyltransferase